MSIYKLYLNYITKNFINDLSLNQTNKKFIKTLIKIVKKMSQSDYTLSLF